MKYFLSLIVLAFIAPAFAQSVPPFTPAGATISVSAPNGSSSASTTLPGAGFGGTVQVYDAGSVPIAFAFANIPGGATATASSTVVAPGTTAYFYIGTNAFDVAAYGIGGTATVYFQLGNGGNSVSTNQSFPLVSGSYTVGDCVKIGVASPVTFVDDGSTCGTGGSMVYPGAGIPLSTGTAWGTSITPGTGVDAALAVNTGSAGSFVVNGGALGTPSSGVATNLTGTSTALNIGGNAATATTATEWGGQALPSLVSGEFLTNNGTSVAWATPTAAASSVTPGTTTVVGATAPCLLDNSTGTTMGCAALGNGFALSSGTLVASSPQRTVTAATDAINCTTDANGVVIYTYSGNVSVSVPQATGSCGAGFAVWVINAGTGHITFTPTTSTINGSASLVISQYGSTALFSNGTNYVAPGCTVCQMPVNNGIATAANSVTPDCHYNNEMTYITSTAYTISAPTNGALTQTAGGSLAATTYYVKTTWVTASGQTTPSTETSLAVSASNVLNVAAPASPPANATGWDVYVSTATGTETLQASNIGTATAWVEPTTGLVAGAALPASNTSGLFTLNAPTGCTPVNGQKIQVNVTSPSGGTLTYAFNTIYLASSSLAFPAASTAASTEDDFLFQYSTTLSKWKFMTVNQGF